jgi:nicotinic acid phosphoribosyltransferase
MKDRRRHGAQGRQVVAEQAAGGGVGGTDGVVMGQKDQHGNAGLVEGGGREHDIS